MTLPSPQTLNLGLIVLAMLCAGSLAGTVMRLLRRSSNPSPTIDNFAARVRAWWIICLVVFGCVLLGPTALIVFFGLVSFLALREFLTLTPTRKADHRSLFYAFFIVTPLQYGLVYTGWYGLFVVFIPVFALLILALLSLIKADCVDYLQRTAKVQWGLLICVYAISHIPALLKLDLPGMPGPTINLLLFLLVVVECSDVFQYIWGKLLGRHRVAPGISPHKTWEGLVLGVMSAVGIGAALWWLTPFNPWQAALVTLLTVSVGFCGGLILSAVKRDAGIKDFGSLIEGHGGVLDRMDSLAFAAPVFFHITRFYFGQDAGVPTLF